MKRLQHSLCTLIALAVGTAATVASAAPNPGELDTRWGVLDSGKTSVPYFGGPNQDVALENTPAATVAGTRGIAKGVMYLAGTVTDLQNRTFMGVAALDPEGSPQQSFSGDGKNLTLGHNLVATAIALSPDETRIYVAGYTTSNAPNYDMIVCQFNTENGANTGFSALPQGTTCIKPLVPGNTQEIATDILVQPDGKIVVAGYSGTQFANRNAAFARFNADGTPDLGFGGDAEFNTSLVRDDTKFVGHEINALALAEDGGFYAVGYTRAVGQIDDAGLLLLLDNNGMKRKSTIAEQAINEDANAEGNTHYQDIAVTKGANGQGAQLIIVGRSEQFAGTYSAVITRFDTTGHRDNAFGESAGRTFASAVDIDLVFTHLALQRDDKAVVLMRRFSENMAETHAMRFGLDGLQDPGFGTAGFTNIDFETVGGYDEPAGLSISGERGVYIAAVASNGGTDTNFHAAKLMLDGLFEDGFESN